MRIYKNLLVSSVLTAFMWAAGANAEALKIRMSVESTRARLPNICWRLFEMFEGRNG